MRLLSAMLALVLLPSCEAQLSHYVRTDGAPVDAAHEKATLAQCKGEGVAAGDPRDYGNKEAMITDVCMARNGYIRAR